MKKNFNTAQIVLLAMTGLIFAFTTIVFLDRIHYSVISTNSVTSAKTIFSMSCDILGVYVLAMFMNRNIFASTKHQVEQNKLFTNFIFSVILLLVSDMVGFSAEGIDTPFVNEVNMIFSSLEYVFNALTIYMFIRYVQTQSWVKKEIFVLREMLFLYMLFVFFSMIFNYFFKFGFAVKNGKFTNFGLSTVYLLANEIFLFMVFFFIDWRKITPIEIITICIYIAIPIVCILLRSIIEDISFVMFGVIISVTLTYVQLYLRQERVLLTQQQLLENERMKLTLSQIKPHFTYNVLNSIASLCLINPTKAMEVTSSFSSYLRTNLDTVNFASVVSVDKEIEYTKHYTDLEKVRFGDRLNVIYNLDSSLNFSLPPLTIQPIVENAIRHGVCEKIEGGTVKITTFLQDETYVVTIQDDGVGFDIKHKNDDGKTHYGLQLVTDRLETICGGKIKVDSVIDKGTTITIYIPKTKQQPSGDEL